MDPDRWVQRGWRWRAWGLGYSPEISNPTATGISTTHDGRRYDPIGKWYRRQPYYEKHGGDFRSKEGRERKKKKLLSKAQGQTTKRIKTYPTLFRTYSSVNRSIDNVLTEPASVGYSRLGLGVLSQRNPRNTTATMIMSVPKRRAP